MRSLTPLQIFIVAVYIIVLAGLVVYTPVAFPVLWVLVGAITAGLLAKYGRI